MTSERWKRINDLYLGLVDLDKPEQQRRLASETIDDPSVRSEVEALLAQSSDVDSFLERPVLATIDDKESKTGFADWLCEGQRIGRYRISSRLGEGGMGIVFLAEQETPRRVVALKIIKPPIARPRMLRRFEHEAEILGRLHHPGIAQIYEAGTASLSMPTIPAGTDVNPNTAREIQLPFFAMEYVEGDSLSEYLSRNRLTVQEKLSLAARICDAVQHAHQRGVIHRDLKPANILIVEDDEAPAGDADALGDSSSIEYRSPGIAAARRMQPKILDFGVARLTDADVKMTTVGSDVAQILGTLPYMSPEQVSGNTSALDTRSDIYTLGVTIYEMLANVLPLSVSGRSLPEAARIICDNDPPPLSQVKRELRGDIEIIVGKAMEKDSERRYASAGELASDLRRYLNDEPILARPTTAWRQIYKFSRRHRALATGCMIALVGVVSGAAFATWQAVEASTERDDAIRARQEAQEYAVVADAVNEFLNDEVITEIDAALGGSDTTVREVLDKATARLDSRFVARPVVEGAIRYSLGRCFLNIGEAELACERLTRALKLQRESYGNDHPITAQSLSALAVASLQLGEYDAATRHLRQCVEFFESTNRTKDSKYLHSKLNLAAALAQQGQLDDAEALYKDGIQLADEILGDGHKSSLTARYMLATIYASRAEYDAAEALYRPVLQAQRRLLGAGHPHTLRTMNNLGLLFKNAGRLDEAAPLLEETLNLQRRGLGPNHLHTLTTLNNLAITYDEMGDYDRATPLLESCVELMKARLGRSHPNTLSAMNNLAASYGSQNRLDAAEEIWTTVLSLQNEALGENHPATLVTRGGLARLYTSQRRFDEAEGHAVACLEGMTRHFGADHPHSATARKILCTLYTESGDPVKADVFCPESAGRDD